MKGHPTPKVCVYSHSHMLSHYTDIFSFFLPENVCKLNLLSGEKTSHLSEFLSNNIEFKFQYSNLLDCLTMVAATDLREDSDNYITYSTVVFCQNKFYYRFHHVPIFTRMATDILTQLLDGCFCIDAADIHHMCIQSISVEEY